MVRQKIRQRLSFFYEKASNFGDSTASLELFNAYLIGKLELGEDMKKALLHLERAGSQGNEYALRKLVDMYSRDGEIEDKNIMANPIKAGEWERKIEEIRNPLLLDTFIFNLRKLQN